MKKFAALVLFAACALVSSAAAVEHSRAQVPFEFVMGGKVMPAGAYDIYLNADARTLRVQGIDSTASATVVYIPEDNISAASAADKLIFQNRGNVNVLRQAAVGSSKVSVPAGKAEGLALAAASSHGVTRSSD